MSGVPNSTLAQALSGIMRRELQASDVSVSCVEGTLMESVCVPSEGPAAFCITIVLKGSGRTCISGLQPLELAAGTMAVFWSSGPVSGFDQIDGGEPILAVDIRLDPAYLQEIVGSIAARLRSALLIDRSDPDAGTILVGLPLPARLIEIARDILFCALQDTQLRTLYVRGKALEAVALTVEALAHVSPPALRLSARDRGKILDARNLLDSAYGEPWTIASLATAVGLSDTKLKIGFREMLGSSVRAYLREVRIERAAALITAGETATEAALATGYQNLSHFTKAFRDLKGLAPRDFARNASALYSRSIGE
jgi:AraC-like DNA-binding protein